MSKVIRVRGRPKRIFTDEEIAKIDELAENGCNNETIADYTGIAVVQLNKYFDKKIKQKKAAFRAEIYKNQRKMAFKNVVMSIWLGKQHLGQTDKADIKGDIGLTVKVTLDKIVDKSDK